MSTSISDDRQKFITLLAESLRLVDGMAPGFIGLTLSKPAGSLRPDIDPKRVDYRLISLKGTEVLSGNFRYEHRDETKNFPLPEAVSLVEAALAAQFLAADLHCQGSNHSLRIDRKGSAHLISRRQVASTDQNTPAIVAHNRVKQRHIQAAAPWLRLLGVCDFQGMVIPRMQDKFRQIDKFVEIFDDLIDVWSFPTDGNSSASSDQTITVVDMGCGKAYLTFALYEHLCHRFPVRACGIEQRPELVASGNQSAAAAGFAPSSTGYGLSFVEGSIADWESRAGAAFARPDVLVALHACDTATDDAILAGIRAQAGLIICSPCCHKQVRGDMKVEGITTRITRFGILEGRLAEIITDSVRALVLEAYGYKTKVFEFISAEHTGKNLMISAVRTRDELNLAMCETKLSEARSLAESFGVQRHYLLEQLSVDKD